MMGLPGPLELPWAEVLSVHCVGSYWAPGFSNYLLLFQVINKNIWIFFIRFFILVNQTHEL